MILSTFVYRDASDSSDVRDYGDGCVSSGDSDASISIDSSDYSDASVSNDIKLVT